MNCSLPGPEICLIFSDLADRRLLTRFLEESGYRVHALAPERDRLSLPPEAQQTSLLITDEASASRHWSALIQLKREARPLYLPLLLTLASHRKAAPWLRAGIDDVLRLPLNKDDLLARLETFMRLRRHSQDQVNESNLRYRATFDLAPAGIAHLALDGCITLANQRLSDMLQIDDAVGDALIGKRLLDLADSAAHGPLQEAIAALLAGTELTSPPLDLQLHGRDGITIWAVIRMTAACDTAGTPLHLIAVIEDISERKEMEREIRASEQFVKSTIDALPEHICVIDEGGQVLAVNDAWRRFGSQNGAPTTVDWRRVNYLDVCRHAAATGDNEASVFLDGLNAVIQGKREEFALEYPCHSDSEQRWFLAKVSRFQKSDPVRVLIAHENVTNVKRAEQELLYLAHYDGLTGLPNRVLFYERLQQGLLQTQRNGRISAVMFIDLDHFKLVNDTLGHAAGDRLLQEAGRRISACLRRNDTAARLGGDEFCVFLAELAAEQDAALVADKLSNVLNKPFLIDGNEVFVTPSIGITLSPMDGRDADTLVCCADTAMYRAKQTGRNNYQYFTAHMNETLVKRARLENGLRRALERNELFLEYQPQVDTATGRIIGMEALMRWQHPELGLLSPANFIPVAEETGLIVPMGAWALQTACRQNKEWQEAGLEPVVVAVNLSARQFKHNNLYDTVRKALHDSELEGRYLELEVTESIVMEQAETLSTTMHRLKSLGVRLALDDFGTGYSNLGYLKRFPLDIIKIDKSFIDDICEGEDGSMIAATIVNLAHNLRLQVIAEGVETAEQLAVLRKLGCDFAQGYLFSRPVSATAMAVMLREQASVSSL